MPASIWLGVSVAGRLGARTCDHAGKEDAAWREAHAISRVAFMGGSGQGGATLRRASYFALSFAAIAGRREDSAFVDTAEAR
jgi:hypothetical protein